MACASTAVTGCPDLECCRSCCGRISGGCDVFEALPDKGLLGTDGARAVLGLLALAASSAV